RPPREATRRAPTRHGGGIAARGSSARSSPIGGYPRNSVCRLSNISSTGVLPAERQFSRPFSAERDVGGGYPYGRGTGARSAPGARGGSAFRGRPAAWMSRSHSQSRWISRSISVDASRYPLAPRGSPSKRSGSLHAIDTGAKLPRLQSSDP